MVSRSKGASKQKVVIIGAGISGMAAALELIVQGYSVEILEAQHRPGGRVQTIRDPFSDGLYAEAGATYIPGNHDLTNAYLKRFNIGLHAIAEEGLFTLWNFKGKRIRLGSNEDWPVELTAKEREMGLMGMLEAYVGPGIEALGDISADDWPSPELDRFDNISYYDYLVQVGASPAAISIIRHFFPDIYGEGIEDASALFCLRDFGNEGNGWSLVEGGSDRLPYAMAAELSEHIRYGARVNRIEHGPDGVAVRFVQAGETRWTQGDRLIIALQFSCLKTIDVSPAFSPNKTKVISSLGHSPVSRVFLQVDERYWGTDGPDYMSISDTPSMIGIREASFHLPGKRRLLDCYIPRAAAYQIADMDEETRVRTVADYVNSAFPGLNEHIELGASKCWTSDPYARGGYLYYRPGEMRSLIPLVRQPEGVVHFAGDHASPWPAWIQGALHAAVRVVKEIGGNV
jgi:monoamine oxidase